jgi:hypothetical protein
MAKRKRHPVWDVYDEYRTTLYQVKAHTHKIHRLRKLSRWMDIALAVFTPSSAVAGLFFWNTQTGKLDQKDISEEDSSRVIPAKRWKKISDNP